MKNLLAPVVEINSFDCSNNDQKAINLMNWYVNCANKENCHFYKDNFKHWVRATPLPIGYEYGCSGNHVWLHRPDGTRIWIAYLIRTE